MIRFPIVYSLHRIRMFLGRDPVSHDKLSMNSRTPDPIAITGAHVDIFGSPHGDGQLIDTVGGSLVI